MKSKIGLIFFYLFTSLSLYAPSAHDALHLLEGKKNLIHVAIIGAGPAGLSAAIPPTRSGYHTVIFEGLKPGGELMNAMVVENWPGVKKDSGAHTMNALEKQVKQFGAHFAPQEVRSVDFSQWPFVLTLSDGTSINALTVIAATGASQKKLGFEGEDTYFGKGIFTCGICDSSFAREKDIIIIGGNDIAIQRALQLASLARNITFIVPGPRMTAQKSMLRKLKGMKNIHYLYNKKIIGVKGEETKISHAEIFDCKTQKYSIIKTDSIFLSTGLTPNSELFKEHLPLDQHKCIKLREGRSQKTPIDGIMAAGCVSDPVYRQVAVVIGDGTKAGMDALTFLSLWGLDGVSQKAIHKDLYIPPASTSIQHIQTVSELNNATKRTQLPLLVEFYSPLCPSCRKMEAPLLALREKYKNLVKILKVKVDQDQQTTLIDKQNITIIPAFVLFNKGKEIKRLEGEATQETLSSFIDTAAKGRSKKRTTPLKNS
ncbi:FAD-dependent oxidoreductase [Candidatus Dependentiae bacterium]|nr:FAD-dependent oxidoreductase [Candidatus Dependentiae bacterium]